MEPIAAWSPYLFTGRSVNSQNTGRTLLSIQIRLVIFYLTYIDTKFSHRENCRYCAKNRTDSLIVAVTGYFRHSMELKQSKVLIRTLAQLRFNPITYSKRQPNHLAERKCIQPWLNWIRIARLMNWRNFFRRDYICNVFKGRQSNALYWSTWKFRRHHQLLCEIVIR